MHLGAGWTLKHLTDRVIELTKDDVAYRRFTGRDGYVRLRAEPGMDRTAMLDAAITMAKRNDEELSMLVGKHLIPKARRYHMQQRQMATVFGVPQEEPEERMYAP